MDEDWTQTIKRFLLRATETIQRRVQPEDLPPYVEELGALLGECATFTYFTRGTRDASLGAAYIDHPKGSMNADEQVAVCRMEASDDVRLHELLKDIARAASQRLSSAQTIVNLRKVER